MKRPAHVPSPAPSQHIAHVQKDGFANYVKGPLFRRSMHQVLGEGIFVVDGHPWQYVQVILPTQRDSGS